MPETVTDAKLRKLCKRIEASNMLPGYKALNTLLVRPPVQDGLLRCIIFHRAVYLPEELNITAVYVPLYVELPAFILEYPKPVKPGSGFWQLSDEEQFVAAIIKDADAFLTQATSAIEFTRIAHRLRQTCDEDKVIEHVAMSYAKAGELVQARVRLEYLNAKYIFHRLRDARTRIQPVLQALRRGAPVDNIFEKQIQETIKLLDLQGIEPFLQ